MSDSMQKLELGPIHIPIPADWDSAELHEKLSLISGVNYSSEQLQEKPDSAAVFLTLNTIQKGGGYKLGSEKYFTGDIPEEKSLEEGDVVIADTDVTQDGDVVGYSAQVPKFEGKNVTASMDLSILEPTDESYNKHFLNYLLRAKPLHDRMRAFSAGSTVLHLNTDLAEHLKLPVPPLPEQRKIASVLYNVDQAIQKTEEIIEQTKLVKQGVMQDLFTEGYHDHEEFEETKIGRMPKDWDVRNLGNIAEVSRGKFTHRPRNDPDFYGGEHPFIQTGEVVEAKGRVEDYSQTLNQKGLDVSKKFSEGTIIMTIAGNIGDTAIADFPVSFPDSLVGIKTCEDVNTEYLEFFLRFRKRHLERMSTKTTQRNLNLSLLRPRKIAVPPLEEQQKIASALKSYDEREKTEKNQKEQLQRLKKGLMQDLLIGEVRTKDRDIEVLDAVKEVEKV